MQDNIEMDEQKDQKCSIIQLSRLNNRDREEVTWQKHSKRVLQFSLLMFMASLSGCTTLSTQNVDPPSGPINGMLYYLPIGKITIAGAFEELAIPAVDDPPVAGPAPTVARQNIVTTQLKITLTPEVEADKDAGVYYATPHANYLFEDDVQIKLGAKRLLETGNVTTEDKTIAIVQEITSLASQIATGAKIMASPNRRPFNFTFRPTVYREYAYVREQLSARGITFKVDPTPTGNDKDIAMDRKQAGQLGARGLVFRPGVAYDVSIKFGDIVANRQQFIFPDPGQLYEIGYPRISFIKHQKDIGFTDGMLTSFHEVTPSPILGLFGLPKAIIKAVLPVPSS